MKTRYVIAICAAAAAFVGFLENPAHAEIDQPWEVITDADNPFAKDGVKVFAGSGWIGGVRGVALTCDSYMEISDFNWTSDMTALTSIPVGIAVDGQIVATMVAKAVELGSGKAGLKASLTPDIRDKIANALVGAKKAIHLQGIYEGGQKITARHSTVAGNELLRKCN